MLACFQWIILVGIGVTACDHGEVSPPFKFLGLAEDQVSGEGPVGLINGVTLQVDTISRVKNATYQEFQRAKKAKRIIAKKKHQGFVYWAVKVERDIPYDYATAWITVIERKKSKLP